MVRGFVFLVFTAMTLCRLAAAEVVIKDKQGMNCHVYLPEAIDPGKTYQLVVGVHHAGGGGRGAGGLAGWAKRGDVIVIGPSFQTRGERPYQNGNGIHAEKLINLFDTLKTVFKLRERMFLHGHSGGSQFVHRFAMLHPELVCGVSAHSGGSWATDNYGRFNPEAKHIPFAISCGERDTKRAFSNAPYNRVDWLKRFAGEIDQQKFPHIAKVWPGVGHGMSEGARSLLRQCFQISTGLPGQSATERIEISPDWKNLSADMIRAMAVVDPTSMSDAQRAQIFQVSFARADAEEIADDLLINFMQNHPPSLWKDMPGSERLLAQCTAAAVAWQSAAKENRTWNDTMKLRFALFTSGLNIGMN